MHKGAVEIGLDEAGRGCLAGPVYAAAVIIPKGVRLPGLNDSKKLTLAKRNKLRSLIERKTQWAVGICSQTEIDRLNILNASFLAMHRAVEGLEVDADMLLVDGNRFNAYRGVAHTCIIKGDSKYAAIAAASILAKTHRDEKMHELHAKYPAYHWDQNMGYPTSVHREAIALNGPCEIHRKSFKLLPEKQLEIFEPIA